MQLYLIFIDLWMKTLEQKDRKVQKAVVKRQHDCGQEIYMDKNDIYNIKQKMLKEEREIKK